MLDKREGTLMRHELAYCLGQMRDATALPVLEKVLRDTSDDPIVRHEVGVPKARQHEPALPPCTCCTRTPLP